MGINDPIPYASVYLKAESDKRMHELCDKIAEAIRIEYALVINASRPDISNHIEHAPWSSLNDDRKKKWRAMARVSMNIVGEELANDILEGLREVWHGPNSG
jgi:hypothetical protein